MGNTSSLSSSSPFPAGSTVTPSNQHRSRTTPTPSTAKGPSLPNDLMQVDDEGHDKDHPLHRIHISSTNDGDVPLFPFEKEAEEVVELISRANLSSPSLKKFQISITPIIPPDGREKVRQLYRNAAKIVHGFGPGGLAPLTRKSDTTSTSATIVASSRSAKEVIPIMLSWSGGGKTVFVTGSFNNWTQKIRMIKSTADFSTIIDMPKGTHKFKFIVDSEWKCSEDFPIGNDEEGNLINVLQVLDETGVEQGDGLDALAADVDSVATLRHPGPPDDQFSREIPAYLTDNKTVITPLDAHGYPDESFQQVPGYNYIIPPPLLPCHLEKVPLNVRDDSQLPIPSHSILNHLYASSIRDGVIAVGSTSRYKSKYMTTILYKPLNV